MEVYNMNAKTMKWALRAMIAMMAISLIGNSVAAQGAAETTEETIDWGKSLGAGIAVGLAAVGAGISQAAIGSAAVGMLAEDDSKFGVALIFTALPESLVILGLMPLFL